MQTFTACCGNMKRYKRRRRYRRLRNAVTNEQNAMVSMGKCLKFGKIRVTPMLRMKVKSSITLLKKFRNAYVEMMFCFAGRVMQLNNGDVHLYRKTNASQFLAYLSSPCVISQSISHTLRHRETDFEEASMECYSQRRRRSSSSSRGCPYSRIDNFVTDDDEEEENEKIAVVLGQRQSSDLNFKNTTRRGIPLPKLQRAIMSSIVLLKRYRDAYVGVMHSVAEHVVQLNNGNSYFFKKLPNAP